MKMVGLIPARGGSKRIPGKNIKLLAGKPLIVYTIEAALESGVFSRVIVSSDDEETLRICGRYDVLCQKRPAEFATDDAPDILWVRHALESYSQDSKPDAFAILRPTSPFRSAATIALAFQEFMTEDPCDSLRAVRDVTEHPGKMWAAHRMMRLVPLLPYYTRTGEFSRDTPWHSTPTLSLPRFYIQTGGLEMAWTKTVFMTHTIAGTSVKAFRLDGREAIDINTPDDWARAEQIASELYATPASQT